MGFTCVLETNIFLVGRYWDFNLIMLIFSFYCKLVFPFDTFYEKLMSHCKSIGCNKKKSVELFMSAESFRLIFMGRQHSD